MGQWVRVWAQQAARTARATYPSSTATRTWSTAPRAEADMFGAAFWKELEQTTASSSSAGQSAVCSRHTPGIADSLFAMCSKACAPLSKVSPPLRNSTVKGQTREL
eukprot:CAMPEP_0117669522 /NCGR_PEP_ID=MMETSP0804-20121206/12180_1 /TAXON_ID=1074897 /ORGANISM="Tetraselmis astigmatica, Strain CCMP880" /LENGTH=105 /DNA_ID=CAMNT_0005477591 /DNA_START=472 /DNA_END=789 /DNA_ORIENTATION=+